MVYKNILLTGSTGHLGSAIKESDKFQNILTPTRKVLDITNSETIEKFFQNNEIDAVIHCAALARMKKCEEDPITALKTNVIGTSNLVKEVIKKEKNTQKQIRFIQISTDGVYQGTRGNYSEDDATLPYNKYGWTKLGAECVVQILSNFCIIRTSFFDPKNIKFNDAATDAYSSRVTIDYLVNAIKKMIERDFIGIINIGDEKKSGYERYKEFKPLIKKCKFEDIQNYAQIPLAKDCSMNCNKWNSL